MPDAYRTAAEGARPYVATVGDRSFTFAARASARTHLALAEMSEDGVGPARRARFLRDALAEMLAEPDRADELLGLLDLREAARLVATAMRRVEHG